MRILQIVRKKIGGVGVYAEELEKALKRLGVGSAIMERKNFGFNSFVSSLLSFNKAVEKIIKKLKIDAIIAHDWSIALPLFSLSGMLPVLCIFHGLEPSPLGRVFQYLTYYLYSSRNSCYVVSKYLQQYFKRAKLLPGGVDLKLFRPTEPLPLKNLRGPVVGYAQRPTAEYNFQQIAKAVELLGGTLLVAWDPEAVPKADHIVPVGYLPREKMPSFYSTLEVFVSLPPSTTGFNLVWLEALACNVPTVGNKFGVGSELPLVHPRSSRPEEIAEAILRAREMQGENFRDTILKRGYTWDKTARKVIEEIHEKIRGN